MTAGANLYIFISYDDAVALAEVVVIASVEDE